MNHFARITLETHPRTKKNKIARTILAYHSNRKRFLSSLQGAPRVEQIPASLQVKDRWYGLKETSRKLKQILHPKNLIP